MTSLAVQNESHFSSYKDDDSTTLRKTNNTEYGARSQIKYQQLRKETLCIGTHQEYIMKRERESRTPHSPIGNTLGKVT